MSRAAFRAFAVVPCAGRSVRMGSPKLLLPWRSGTVIQRVLAVWRESGVDEVVAVVRPGDRPLADACRSSGAVVVEPQAPPPEMKDSVAAALDWIGRSASPAAGDVWLLAPADLPRLNAATILALLARHDPAAPRVLVPVAGGRRGHPVLFPWPLAKEVLALGSNDGLNVLVRRNRPLEVAVDDPSIHDDLDTPEQYRRLVEEPPGR